MQRIAVPIVVVLSVAFVACGMPEGRSGGAPPHVMRTATSDAGGGVAAQASTSTSYSDPFRCSSPSDEILSCYGIAGGMSSACYQIADANQRNLCLAMSLRSPSPCYSIVDTNIRSACQAMSTRFFSDQTLYCATITDPGMRAFCQAVGSFTPGPCMTIGDNNTRNLCLAMTDRSPSFCTSIYDGNDRNFCLGVASANTVYCAGGSPTPMPTVTPTPTPTPAGYGIDFHGGAVMTGGVNVHYIYYGNWSTSDRAALDNLASSIGGSPYFNVNTTYRDARLTPVTNAVHYAGSVDDAYSRGTSLTNEDVYAIVAAHADSDPSGIWFVLTSQDVAQGDFCTSYCGWHSSTRLPNGDSTRLAWVGNPGRCPAKCSPTYWIGSTAAHLWYASFGADSANAIAHELEEAVTDGYGDAWYDSTGNENADKCAWKFGQTYQTQGLDIANVNLGGRDYLIQQNWVNAPGVGCAMSY